MNMLVAWVKVLDVVSEKNINLLIYGKTCQKI